MEGDQLSLLGAKARRRPAGTAARKRPTDPTDPTDPQGSPGSVVQVRIDSPVPHLDRDFDYLVPEALASAAVPGARVRVRFSGRLMDAYVVGDCDAGRHDRPLRPIERVIGIEPVLTAATLQLVEQVAERNAGTFADVARAAVPPRHARAERNVVTPVTGPIAVERAEDGRVAGADAWDSYDSGPALLARLAAPTAAPTVASTAVPTRAVWSAAPSSRWPDEVAALARSVLVQPDGDVLVIVPDAADVARLLDRLAAERAAGVVGTLTADAGPQRRYHEFVRVLRGGVRLVVGTRAAVFAPLARLRLLVVWDDGDDALADPQAPYWDAREVAALRSHLSACDLVVGGPARSVATEHWCATGWAHSVVPSRAVSASRGARVRALSADDAARDPAAAAARIPHTAWQAARDGLRDGPVLVQVARRGYVPSLSCQRCRALARCPQCDGPLALSAAGSLPACQWCGRPCTDWRCPECQGARLRAVDVGAERTVEEIGRAFPGVPVVASHAGHVIARVPSTPQVVVATPGAEPDCDPGYRAVLLLDARAQVQRTRLAAAEDAARRWFAAVRLAAPGARVVVTAPNATPAVQALLRWDASGLAQRELAERAAAGLPPATRIAQLLGRSDDIADLVATLRVAHRVLGPVPVGADGRQRALVLVDRADGARLARELRTATARRSARSDALPVHVHLDPRDL